ncbi:uncharacterized protein LOC120001138 [Tripterygium wilfordii]|uniref:uncharacterized protein LOC120001138 n=1 Tax=Tripterygium wilfordii TaxID=458696 RepID=UPI0018F8162B|nr:uncharacterized protein LOC120001138 [Tripterygium wilfordii]
MDRPDASQPIVIIMNGSNYIPWAQAMTSFLKGRRLWRYITVDITKPKPKDKEPADPEKLEEWDSKNHQIITWIRNTCTHSISLQFGRFSTAQSLWAFLEQRYTTSDLAHQYQLLTTLHQIKQKPSQSINNFLSELYFIWDQLASSEPMFTDLESATKFTAYRDQQHLVLFLMALLDEFEHVRASLIHRNPLPTLDQAVTELLSEETRLQPRQKIPTDVVFATPNTRGSSFGSFKNWCNYCKTTGHILLDCPVRICQFCKKGDLVIFNETALIILIDPLHLSPIHIEDPYLNQ